MAVLTGVVGCGRNDQTGPSLTTLVGVSALACSPDGKLLAVAHGEPLGASVWDLTTKNAIHAPVPGRFDKLVFSSDSKHVYGIASISNIAIWDAKTGIILHEHPLPEFKKNGGIALARLIELCADGKSAYAVHDDFQLLKIDLNGSVTRMPTEDKSFGCSAYSPALDILVTRGNKWNELELIKPGEKGPGINLTMQDARPNTRLDVKALAFSADGKTLAISMSPSIHKEEQKDRCDRVEFWDTKEWKVRCRIPKTDSPDFRSYESNEMAISPDGKYLAGRPFGSMVVQIWDIAAQKVVQTKPFNDLTSCMAFTPDSKTLMLGLCNSGIQFVEMSATDK